MVESLTLNRVAARNLRRQPGRSLAALAGVALAVALVTLLALGYWGSLEAADRGLGRLGADLLVVPAGAETGRGPEALLIGSTGTRFLSPDLAAELRAIYGIQVVTPHLYLPPTPSPTGDGEWRVVGFDPETDFALSPWLAAPAPEPFPAGGALVGAGIAAEVGGLGSRLSLYGRSFQVVGHLEPTGTALDRAVVIPLAAARELWMDSRAAGAGVASGQAGPGSVGAGPSAGLTDPGQGGVSAFLIRTVDWLPAPSLAEYLEQEYPGIDALPRSMVAKSVANRFVDALGWVIWAAGAALATALLLVGVLFAAIVTERQRELGLIRAMGATAGHALRLILTEAAILSAAGGAAGSATGLVGFYLLRGWMAAALSLPHVAPALGEMLAIAAATPVVATMAGVLAAAYPALRAARMEPYAAVRRSG